MRRLTESATLRDRTLWEAVLDFLGAQGSVTRERLFAHFRRDPGHNGCEDECGCEAVRRAEYDLPYSGNACDGVDLALASATGCGACQDSTIAIVVANYGKTAFHGHASVSFESVSPDLDPPAFPGPVNVALDLDPNQLSKPFHVPSAGAGQAYLRVTADGDCAPEDDRTNAELPSPTSLCE